MKKKTRAVWCIALGLCLAATGCGKASEKTSPLDPQHPTTVVLWNYYNGQTKSAFDALVTQFNETVGMEEGIVVDSVSHGDLQQLADAVYAAAVDELGAEELPHIFAGYPDNVYRLDQLGAVADLQQYMTPEEVSNYRQDFLRDCYLGSDNGLKVMPAARSSEVLFLNRTDWNVFAQATGATLDQLATWEGVAQMAGDYYHWTDAQTAAVGDGKAFFGVDSFANYILIASMQLGQEMYEVEGQGVTLHFDEAFARTIWDSLYVPYFNGYYANYGSFRSDDAKTGDILAYVGSSAGAQYFPTEIALVQAQAHKVESAVLPYPCYAAGTPYAMAQGAGFAVSKSDETREYAAVRFLRWFTAPAQNVQFAVASGYLPVENVALDMDLAAETQKYIGSDAESLSVISTVKTTQTMLRDYQLYANRSFDGSYELRLLLNRSLLEQLERDRQHLASLTGAALDAEKVRLAGDEGFAAWHSAFMAEASQILGE